MTSGGRGRSLGWAVLVLAWALIWTAGCSAPVPRSRSRVDWGAVASQSLRGLIRGSAEAPTIQLLGGPTSAAPDLPRFYQQRGYRPAWCGPFGLLPQAGELIAALDSTADDGLRPEEYRLARMRQLSLGLGRPRPAGRGLPSPALLELELLLTDAFLRCAADLEQGRVEPRRLLPEWTAPDPRTDLPELLQRSLAPSKVSAALAGLRPAHPGYERLRQALGRYRRLEVQGGWGEPPSSSITPGTTGPAVLALARRLTATGDLQEPLPDSSRFGAELQRALRRYQRRHGLAVTGQVDGATRRALAVSLADRRSLLEVNLERWRWLPHDRTGRYLLVRLTEQRLEGIEAGAPVLEMKVVTGKPSTRTPAFSAAVTYVELNPYWYVPRSIALDEVLPEVQQDTTYLTRKGIRVARGSGDAARAVPADSIDWQAQDPTAFEYLFFQLPGPDNPLGRAKFTFPNAFDVYLHDTPEIDLFARPVREFSHGCVRVEHWLDLAVFVLAGEWDRPRIEEEVGTGKNQVVRLASPLPVYLVYWSAWVDEEDQVQFRLAPDGSDETLAAALAAR
ncbi:MAG: L,D-transpeptidase family protein [Candidatus Latescibacterota bacterium]|jgi:murein L,D-transpeptidase YcbB/YkuD